MPSIHGSRQTLVIKYPTATQRTEHSTRDLACATTEEDGKSARGRLRVTPWAWRESGHYPAVCECAATPAPTRPLLPSSRCPSQYIAAYRCRLKNVVRRSRTARFPPPSFLVVRHPPLRTSRAMTWAVQNRVPSQGVALFRKALQALLEPVLAGLAENDLVEATILPSYPRSSLEELKETTEEE